MKASFLILLCLVGFLSLPILVKASSSRVSYNLRSSSDGWDFWNQLVVRNITGTGTITVDNYGTTIFCDNGESFTNPFGMYAIIADKGSKRVFFTIGIIDLSNTVLIPETTPIYFVEYQMIDLPQEADYVSVSKLFGATQKTFMLSCPANGPVIPLPWGYGIMYKRSVYGLDYSASYDLNSDDTINMRDIAMAVTNFENLANTLI